MYAYGVLRHFPKAERAGLAGEIKRCLWQLLRLIIVCNKRYYKKTTMHELDAELDVLRSYMRLARDLALLPKAKYEVWARQVDEIGRMLGGWLKSLRGPAAAAGSGPD